MAKTKRKAGKGKGWKPPQPKQKTPEQILADIELRIEEYELVKWPKQPTEALPGTLEKMDVMRARVAKGLHPHHPNDRRREL